MHLGGKNSSFRSKDKNPENTMNPKTVLNTLAFVLTVPLALCVIALVLVWALVLPFWVHAQLCLWWGHVWGSLITATMTFLVNPALSKSDPRSWLGGVLVFGFLLWLLSWLTVPLFLPILFQ